MSPLRSLDYSSYRGFQSLEGSIPPCPTLNKQVVLEACECLSGLRV